MTTQQLREQLNAERIHKPQVNYFVSEVLTYPYLVQSLLTIVHEQDKEGVFNASWVFDHVLRQQPDLILLVIDTFIDELEHMQSESCIRCMARACQTIAEHYFKIKNPFFKAQITPKHLETMATVCFDWLIAEHKVATKVFAMTCLFYAGEKFSWIRPELKLYLEQHIGSGSAGFQNRGGKLLVKLKNLGY